MRSCIVLILLLVGLSFSQDVSRTGKLKANTVRTGNIVDSAIDSSKIKAGVIENVHIKASGIDSSKISSIPNNSVTTAKIADDAVDSTKIGIRSIQGDNLANSAITSAKLGISVSDTTTMKALSVSVGNPVYYNGTEIGEGTFIVKASGTADGITTIRMDDGTYLVREESLYSDYWNVTWGGVVADSSINSTSAFANLLNKLPSNNGVYLKRILFPEGDFRIDSIASFTGNFNHGLILDGAGINRTSIWSYDNTDRWMQIGDEDDSPTNPYNGQCDFIFSNLSIYGATTSEAREGVGIISFGWGHIVLDNVRLAFFDRAFVGAYGTDFFRVYNCVFSANNNGLYLGVGCNQYSINQTEFYMNFVTDAVLDGAKEGTFNNSHFLFNDSIGVWIRSMSAKDGIHNKYYTPSLKAWYYYASNISFRECTWESGDTKVGTFIQIGDSINPQSLKGIKFKNPTFISGGSGDYDTTESVFRFMGGPTGIIIEGMKYNGDKHDWLFDNIDNNASTNVFVVDYNKWDASISDSEKWRNRVDGMREERHAGEIYYLDGNSESTIVLSIGDQAVNSIRIRNAGLNQLFIDRYDGSSWQSEFNILGFENSFTLAGTWKFKEISDTLCVINIGVDTTRISPARK